MTVSQYLDNINKRYLLGNATEYTFRGDLKQLIPDFKTIMLTMLKLLEDGNPKSLSDGWGIVGGKHQQWRNQQVVL